MSDIIWQTLILAVLTLGTFAWSKVLYAPPIPKRTIRPCVPVAFGKVSTGELKSPATINTKGKAAAVAEEEEEQGSRR